MQEEQEINRIKNMQQFEQCAECIHCERYIPLNYLNSHQEKCQANQDKEDFHEQKIKSIMDPKKNKLDQPFNFLKKQSSKSIDYQNHQYKQNIKRQKPLKKPQYFNGQYARPKEEQNEHQQRMEDEIVFLPCQNCGQNFHIQQFQDHQSICLYNRLISYKNCVFCGQPFPQDNCDQHTRVCIVRLEIEKQTQLFNKKSQEGLLKKPLCKKLKVTYYRAFNTNNVQKNRSLREKKSGAQINNKEISIPNFSPKNSDSAIRQTKNIQRSALKAQSYECSICFTTIQRFNKIYDLVCNHKYHQICLDPWLKDSDKCPMCKKVAITK